MPVCVHTYAITYAIILMYTHLAPMLYMSHCHVLPLQGHVSLLMKVCMCIYSHFHNDCFFLKDKKTLFVDFRTETLRTKLERVHFGSGIETRVFFSGKKKVNHYENESTVTHIHTHTEIKLA